MWNHGARSLSRRLNTETPICFPHNRKSLEGNCTSHDSWQQYSSRNLFLKLNPDHFHSLQALVCRFSTIRLKEGRAYKIRHLQSIATRCEVCISIHEGCLGSLEPCNVTTGDICGWIFSRPLLLCVFPLANACLLKIPPFTLWVRQNRVNCRLIKPVGVSVVLTVHSGEDKVPIFLRSLAGFEIISSTWRLP